MFKQSSFDPSKVTTIYGLLTAFLVISESLLGAWMFKAGGPSERIVAGILIVVVFLAFLLLVFKIKNILATPQPKLDDLNITPAKKEVSVEEVKSVTAEQISGPGGSYTINTPPDNWNIKYVDLDGLVKENMGLEESAPSFIPTGTYGLQKNVLLLQSKNYYEVIPVPGKTVVNGRIIPTALTTRLPMQLAIIPLERLQPPFYSENPFEHNVYTFIGQMLQTGLFNMHQTFSGIIPHSKREFIQADLLQQLDHVDFSLNSQLIKDCTGIKNNLTVIGIKGDIVDHLLLTYYPSWPHENIFNILNDELEILKSLSNSFKPLKEARPAEKLNEIRERGRQSYEMVLANLDDTAFWTEMALAIAKIRGLNQKNTSDQKRIINLLQPFKKLYAEMKMNEPDLEKLWENLSKAEKGEMTPFLDNVNDLIDEIDEAAVANAAGDSANDIKQIEAPQ